MEIAPAQTTDPPAPQGAACGLDIGARTASGPGFVRQSTGSPTDYQRDPLRGVLLDMILRNEAARKHGRR